MKTNYQVNSLLHNLYYKRTNSLSATLSAYDFVYVYVCCAQDLYVGAYVNG